MYQYRIQQLPVCIIKKIRIVEGKMNLTIRKWRIDDKSNLAINLNNLRVLNNLRDGLPYPYTEKDAEDFIHAM